MTDKQIVIETLVFINDHSGNVNVMPRWQQLGLTPRDHNRILLILTKNGLVNLDTFNKWQMTITIPKGMNVLHNPQLLNNDGNFIDENNLMQRFYKNYPLIFGAIAFVLGVILTKGVDVAFDKLTKDEKKSDKQTMTISDTLPKNHNH